MNKLKPYFILLALWYWMVLLFIAGYFIYIEGLNLATLGMLASSLMPLGFFFGLNLAYTARTSPSQFFLTLLILVGVLLQLTKINEIGFFVIALYVLSFLFWLLYLHWYSHIDVMESSILKLGISLPELEFSTYEKERFYSSMLLGKKVVYLFYRGNWCPVDMVQIKEFTRQYANLEERGAEIVLVSPQPFSESKKLANRLNVNFRFLTDIGNKMACRLEIENKHGVPIAKTGKYDPDTVVPTVIITDEHGKIIYVDQTTNYRVRPDPGVYLGALATN